MEDRRGFWVAAVVLSPFLFLLLWADPPSWIASSYDTMFMSGFKSAEGGFAIDVPKRWKVGEPSQSKAWRSFAYKLGWLRENSYLDAWYLSLRHGGHYYYALVRVHKIAYGANEVPPMEEFAKELLYKRGIGGRLTKIQFKAQRLKSYPSSKMTLAAGRDTFVCWQVLDDKSNRYVIQFYTNRFRDYEKVFEKMMQSFSFRIQHLRSPM
ncbi:MAG: hypothetical protein LBP21_06590 [Synergistaceae bacterium]|jgi:hypothetical protein|nr:hypothetical protein [Synergistaceae bacterium]